MLLSPSNRLVEREIDARMARTRSSSQRTTGEISEKQIILFSLLIGGAGAGDIRISRQCFDDVAGPLSPPVGYAVIYRLS